MLMPASRPRARLALTLCLVSTLFGCGFFEELVEPFIHPDFDAVGAVLKTTTPVAYAASAAMHDVLLGPECNRNPAEGDIVMQDYGGTQRGILATADAARMAIIEFEPECDGRLRLKAGTGTFMFRPNTKFRFDR